MRDNSLSDDICVCPLCSNAGLFAHLIGPMQRGYRMCHVCHLIFMERKYLPDLKTEKERYQAHQNGPQDEGYVRFLMQAVTPTLPFLNNNMCGLDYGCGPTPTLSGLLNKLGLQCHHYDPFFYSGCLDPHYDYIFATEVVEHFYNPATEFQRISTLLRPDGIFTIMTEPWVTLEGFKEWHYAKDITHVCFYHAKTMVFICGQYGFKKMNPEESRVSILKKITQNI